MAPVYTRLEMPGSDLAQFHQHRTCVSWMLLQEVAMLNQVPAACEALLATLSDIYSDII